MMKMAPSSGLEMLDLGLDDSDMLSRTIGVDDYSQSIDLTGAVYYTPFVVSQYRFNGEVVGTVLIQHAKKSSLDRLGMPPSVPRPLEWAWR